MQGYKKNKRPVALVTGFSSGIGLAYSKYLAGNNWELELIAQNPEKAEKAFESLSYPHSRYHLCDLSKPEDLDNVVKAIKAPNLIVANAGITKYGAAAPYLVIPALATCLLYTSPSPRDATLSRMPSSA